MEEWYKQQRVKGSEIVAKYIHIKQDLIDESNMIWNNLFYGNDPSQYNILGIQMRGSDKIQPWGIRRIVSPNEYVPYIGRFIKYFGNKTKIFFATDDKRYLQWIEDHWNSFFFNQEDREKYKYNDIILKQENITRSDNHTAIFEMKYVSKYVIGKEVLMDILLLSKCDWFIHCASAVSEAVFFNNIKLHNHSVHLEYTQNRQIPFWFM